MSKVKKELTPKQQKVRDILGWVATALCIVLIVASLIVSIITIANTDNKDGKIKGLAGHIMMPVQTDSMEPTMMTNDLIITKIYKGDGQDLKVGQVVTYEKLVTDKSSGSLIRIYVTHRIVDLGVNDDGKVVFVTVLGDNPNPQDGDYGEELVNVGNIIATWGTPAEKNADGTFNVTKETQGTNLGQIGAFINLLRNEPTNYFLIVILPLIIIFLIYVFILVRSLIIAKLDKTKEEALATAGIDGLSEEDKRRLAEEYLAQLARESASADADANTDTTENNPFEDENTDKGDEQA